MTYRQPVSERLTEELERLAFEHHDRCVSCGYAFKEADTTHWGYNKSGEAAYACDTCVGELEEVAQRVYFMKRPYAVPSESTALWRYMDFTKFVSLLSTKALYFPSAASFQDPFEGAKGLRKHKNGWDDYFLKFFRRAVRSVPVEIRPTLSEDEIESEAQRLLKDLEVGGELDRTRTFISCWHENEHESEAMWRLYSTSIDYAIAIRTTYKRLYESLGRSPRINIGRVEYIDIQNDIVNVNDAFWRKRKAFEHEREVRAILLRHDQSQDGLLVPCDIETLIECVVLSPQAPAWFVALVKDVCAKYGHDFIAERSALLEEPFF